MKLCIQAIIFLYLILFTENCLDTKYKKTHLSRLIISPWSVIQPRRLSITYFSELNFPQQLLLWQIHQHKCSAAKSQAKARKALHSLRSSSDAAKYQAFCAKLREQPTSCAPPLHCLAHSLTYRQAHSICCTANTREVKRSAKTTCSLADKERVHIWLYHIDTNSDSLRFARALRNDDWRAF